MARNCIIRQILGTPIRTSCARLNAYLLLLFCYQSDFMLSLSNTYQADVIVQSF